MIVDVCQGALVNHIYLYLSLKYVYIYIYLFLFIFAILLGFDHSKILVPLTVLQSTPPWKRTANVLESDQFSTRYGGGSSWDGHQGEVHQNDGFLHAFYMYSIVLVESCLKADRGNGSCQTCGWEILRVTDLRHDGMPSALAAKRSPKSPTLRDDTRVRSSNTNRWGSPSSKSKNGWI